LLLLLALACGLASFARAQDSEDLDLDDLKAFAEAWQHIKSSYVEPIDDRVLLEAAIRGMISELDRHSAWLDEARFKRLEDDALGRYGGLGLRIAIQSDHLQIVDIRPDMPAALAGLRAGDRIVEVDRIRLDADNAEQMALALRGPAGSEVELAVVRRQQDRPERIALTRELIRQTSVDWRALDQDIGLIEIQSFQQSTAAELDRALEELLDANSIRGLIIDLRGNPGGMVQAAVAVADRFLDQGLILASEGRHEGAEQTTLATPGDRLERRPIAVLIDKQTASAAEILAAALRDQERATVFGERSYGKGSVQSIWPLSNGSALRLTTARYRTPAGRDLEDAGVIPDIEVPYSTSDADAVLEKARIWMENELE
jgi:carboxyl-terminal processing protease